MSEVNAVEQQPEVNNRRTVVSSENSQDFYFDKLGLAPEGEETQSKGESEPKAEKEAKDKQKPSKLEKRFSKLTKDKQELKTQVESERKAREQLEARLRELEGNRPQQAPKANAKPKPEQFNDAFEYAEALAEWTAEKAIAEQKKAEAEAKSNEKREKTLKSWAKRVEAFKDEMPNFDSMVQSSDVTVTDDVRDAIIESEFGPQILYHMAENPKFASKLSEMSMSAAMKELGKLEAKFERRAEKAKEAPKAEAIKESVAKKSKAPQPIRPLKASSAAADTPIGSDGEFHGTFAQWREARKAGKIR